MVLQGGEKHCNSCGATTRNKIMGSRFVPSPGKTNDWNLEKKKNTGQARSATSHFISFTAFLYNILWCSFQKKKKHASAFQSLRFASFSMPANRTHETSHMGGDVFVIHTLKSKAVVSYFFSSVTQARIITVQLLARVAAAGRMASVGQLFCRPGESAFNCGVRRLFSVRCKSLKVRLHNVLLPFNSNFLCCVTNNIEHFCICILLYFFDIFLNLSPWFLWIVIFFSVMFNDVKLLPLYKVILCCVQ